MGRRISNISFAAFFFVALLAPITAGVLGMQPERLENRPLTALPAVTPQALSDPSFYAQVTQALVEHNPLRKVAITAAARLQYRFFKSVPAANVLVGPAGWLFLRESLERPCRDQIARNHSFERFEQWTQSLRAEGKTVLFVVAPDKAAIYPEMAPTRKSDEALCASEDNNFWRTRVATTPNEIDAFSILAPSREGQGGKPTYSRGDTHWTDYGSALVAKVILDASSPGMLKGAALQNAGGGIVKPDLSRMSGLYFDEDRQYWRWDRPGEQSRSPEPDPNGAFVVQWGISDGAPMDERNILILHDSFFEITWDHLAAVYAHPVYVHWNKIDPEDFARRARAADVIIVETVQREATARMLKYFGANEVMLKAQNEAEH